MGFLPVPGVPLGAWAPLPELIEDVRDLFMMDSSISEAIPLFRLPGLDEGRRKKKSIFTYVSHSIKVQSVEKMRLDNITPLQKS